MHAKDAQSNVTEYAVSDIAFALKKVVEERFSYVRVRGEVSGYKGPHTSGHVYFTLKDDRARLDAVMWKGVFARASIKPEDGMEMIATGKISTYPGSSKYQIIIERLQPAGVGALMALLEARRQKLAAEGLFDAARKQVPAFLPQVIGVITSPTGAVIRDILHRVMDRFPMHVVVWPVRVQGQTSAQEIGNAIAGFNAVSDGDAGPIPRPDVIIVARGGGSIEDLWGFNEEAVVRAVAASEIAIVSAVGHETDWTLIDHAADVRAPTPTGAAEMIVPVRTELTAKIGHLGARLVGAGQRMVQQKRTEMRAVTAAMPKLADYLDIPRQRIDLTGGRLQAGFARQLFTYRRGLSMSASRHRSGLLERQYSQLRSTLRHLAHRLGLATSGSLAQARLLYATPAQRNSAAPLVRVHQRGASRTMHLAHRLGHGLQRIAEVQRTRYARLSMQLGPVQLGARSRQARSRLRAADNLLQALSYQATLARGFALVRRRDGTPMRAMAPALRERELFIQFHDGQIGVSAPVAVKMPGSYSTPAAPKATLRPQTKAKSQPGLFDEDI